MSIYNGANCKWSKTASAFYITFYCTSSTKTLISIVAKFKNLKLSTFNALKLKKGGIKLAFIVLNIKVYHKSIVSCWSEFIII